MTIKRHLLLYVWKRPKNNGILHLREWLSYLSGVVIYATTLPSRNPLRLVS